ncbi:hypothetical protein QMK33_04015 [Hymenobacter sp. H14-R3]|uniref:hypothetical protein n=1 Tax=Hymenobacter sp. H14-R3 TaxID=3046308 RepID=UPI0024BB0748|nr:hypothetical protein [Hymenobacter sp. H14-R3]MDJ0364304.1 hypothetical protein [Hymenobacter sp. H14-R3]
MNPTPNNTPGTPNPRFDAPLPKTQPASSTEGSTVEDYKQKANEGIQAILDSGKQTIDEGKSWLKDSDLAEKAKELPQKAKELGSQALNRVNGLTNTQKYVSVGLVAAGVAFLIIRGSKNKDKGEYRLKDRRSPFSKKSNREAEDKGSPRAQQRPWGSSRYGTAAAPASAGRGRVNAGSSPKPDHQRDHGQRSAAPAADQRRDQGPASGSRYDATKGGSQNPNNANQLNSAF